MTNLKPFNSLAKFPGDVSFRNGSTDSLTSVMPRSHRAIR
jgi:hypothetical protein